MNGCRPSPRRTKPAGSTNNGDKRPRMERACSFQRTSRSPVFRCTMRASVCLGAHRGQISHLKLVFGSCIIKLQVRVTSSNPSWSETIDISAVNTLLAFSRQVCRIRHPEKKESTSQIKNQNKHQDRSHCIRAARACRDTTEKKDSAIMWALYVAQLWLGLTVYPLNYSSKNSQMRLREKKSKH